MRISPRRILLGLLAVSLVTGTLGTASAAHASTECAKAVLPTPINDGLKAKFAQWRVKQVSDMEADEQNLWLKGPNGAACPGIAIGHFVSADSLSYAFLLVPQSDPTGGHRIVVFNKDTTKDAYTWTLLDHADGQTYSGLVISKTEPGKYNNLESAKSVRIKLDGLYVEWMEKGAVLYFWSEGRFHKIVVSD